MVGFILLYRAYKLTLKHSQRIQRLEEENRRLRQELEELQARYQESLSRGKPTFDAKTPAAYLQRIAEKLEKRKEALL
ncbi:MAG: hypothetical protein ABDH66_00705 [Bacteroidia bacterium]